MAGPIGIVGLGIMGSAFAANLIDAGFEVVGRDVDPARADAFEALGGRALASPEDVAGEASVIITSLPSVAAFHDVTSGDHGLAASNRDGLVVVECSTLPIADKELAMTALAAHGMTLLDCPVSGTGSQAAAKDIVVYASGDEAAYQTAKPALDGIARGVFHVGAFGNGSKLKFIANLLVHIHNAASAEAMVLAMKAGLDPDQVVEVIGAGAGTSRIFELRAPMMAADDYQPATMKIDVWRKDMDVIGAFAAGLDCPVPLFAAAEQLYHAALAADLGAEDTAAICRVYERMAQLAR